MFGKKKVIERKVPEKNVKVFLELLLETKMIAGVGLEPNHVWAPCCETWLIFEIETLRCWEKFFFFFFLNVRVVGVPLVGRHVVNELKVA